MGGTRAGGAAMLLAWVGLGAGCSALTGFGDLDFSRGEETGPRDLGRRDDGAASDAVTPERDTGHGSDGAPPPRDTGPTDGAPPAEDGGPPPIDAGPPPIDAGPPPLDLGPPPRDLGMVVCASDADCDDFEQCTTDSCVGGACRNARLDDTPCDDGNACTATDLCRAGTCVGEGVVFCMPPTVCFVSTCDPGVGCVDVPQPFGVECNDFDPCTPSSMCDGGGDCTGAVSCMDDGNPCTTETCSGLGCVSADVPDGTVCAAGACCGGRCVSTSTDEMNCGSCGHGCASSTSCLSGICTGCGSAAACNDGLTCTVDQCDGTCTNILMPGFCLIDGICRADGAMSPTNPCEECDPMRSSSAWSPRDDGAPCDDGLFCTGEIDQCMGGSCEPSGNPCDAMVAGPCEVFVCNEATNRCVRTGGCTLPDVCCDGDYCGLPLFCR